MSLNTNLENKKYKFYIENNIFYIFKYLITHISIFLIIFVSLTSALGPLVSIF